MTHKRFAPIALAAAMLAAKLWLCGRVGAALEPIGSAPAAVRSITAKAAGATERS